MTSINEILSKKNNEKISVITAYDYQMGLVAEAAGIDMVLVGDSLANIVQGADSTLKVSMDEIVYHSNIVSRALKNSFLVTDMPYLSYNIDIRDSLYNAGRIITEGNAQAVKLEGGQRSLETIKRIIDIEIPVVGHLGLTPQSIHKMGGYKVQGKTLKEAETIFDDALHLERAGVFAIVLEGIPEELGKEISAAISIPTIGIGAGRYTDGQVLVMNDMLGYNDKVPKFVKKYINAKELMVNAVKEYSYEVKSGKFPDSENVYFEKK